MIVSTILVIKDEYIVYTTVSSDCAQCTARLINTALTCIRVSNTGSLCIV